MKVVFAIDVQGQFAHVGNMLKGAIASLLDRTSHSPVVIAPAFVDPLKGWLEERGVECIVTDTPMRPAIEELHRTHGYPLQGIGNYLRYEACRLLADEPAILYCDCDVLFLEDFPDLPPPALVAAAPADDTDDWSLRNSGVLLLNPGAFSAQIDAFYDFARANMLRLLPGFDQAALNDFYGDAIEPLDLAFNWRPYWPHRDGIKVLHFHGVKPDTVQNFFLGRYVLNPIMRAPIEKLVIETLAGIARFGADIPPIALQESESFALLSRLADEARPFPPGTLQRHFSLVADLLARREQEALAADRSAFDTVLGNSEYVEVTLDVPIGFDVRYLRVVVDSSSALFGLTDLTSETGEAASFANATKSGTTIVEHSDGLTIFARQDRTLSPDLVMVLGEAAGGASLRFRLIATGVCDLLFFFAEDMPFTEANSAKVRVLPGTDLFVELGDGADGRPTNVERVPRLRFAKARSIGPSQPGASRVAAAA